MMYPIVISSMVALAVILERLYVFYKNPLPRERAIHEFTDSLRKRNVEKTEEMIQQWRGFMPQLVTGILSGSNRSEREKAASEHGEGFLFMLNERLEILSSLGSLVPIMGLLGTVFGMIEVFSKVARAGDAANISVLAGGIWQALVTTAVGMSVAIPVLLVYYYLSRRIDTTAFYLERYSNRIIDSMDG